MKQIHLGMGKNLFVGQLAVLGGREYSTVAGDEQSAKRAIPMSPRTPRDRKRLAQVGDVI